MIWTLLGLAVLGALLLGPLAFL
ncbi:MAG: hypothetical protein JWN07_931, partial [Hyphomicrobiales bacterium]|nr:hypothetical protein [Hyphomicrobiales bacterium]